MTYEMPRIKKLEEKLKDIEARQPSRFVKDLNYLIQ